MNFITLGAFIPTRERGIPIKKPFRGQFSNAKWLTQVGHQYAMAAFSFMIPVPRSWRWQCARSRHKRTLTRHADSPLCCSTLLCQRARDTLVLPPPPSSGPIYRNGLTHHVLFVSPYRFFWMRDDSFENKTGFWYEVSKKNVLSSMFVLFSFPGKTISMISANGRFPRQLADDVITCLRTGRYRLEKPRRNTHLSKAPTQLRYLIRKATIHAQVHDGT